MDYYNSDLNTSLNCCVHTPFCSFDFDRRNKSIKYECQRTITGLESELSQKYKEIADLRFQLAEKETLNKQLYLDLEKCENDLISAERQYLQNESDMLQDIRSLEIEVLDFIILE
jgi:membrane-bound lytic murein transglycosylase MltF